MKKVIIPRAPGQFSAWGMLMTDIRHDFVRTHVMPCDDRQADEIVRVLGELEAEAVGRFASEGFSLDRVTIVASLDLRYKGQEHTVQTPLSPDAVSARRLTRVIADFHTLHEQAYSFRLDDPVEIVNFHIVGWGKVDKPALEIIADRGGPPHRALKEERSILFEGAGPVRAAVYERELLASGAHLHGPAIVEEPACTTVVCPGQELSVDHYGNLVITEVER